MNNPMEQMKAFIKQGGNPQQIINKVAGQNPMLKNVIDMAQKGDKEGIENFARNLLKEQGRDFDSEFKNFMSNFK